MFAHIAHKFSWAYFLTEALVAADVYLCAAFTTDKEFESANFIVNQDTMFKRIEMVQLAVYIQSDRLELCGLDMSKDAKKFSNAMGDVFDEPVSFIHYSRGSNI